MNRNRVASRVGRRKFNFPIRTEVETPGRNQSCPCGSGRKYKKCCIEERQRIMTPQKTVLSNDFREELEAEKVSDAELMLRDQVIMARAMESNHEQAGFMRTMLEASLSELLDTHAFMLAQPPSEARDGKDDGEDKDDLPGVRYSVEIQILKMRKRLLAPVVSRADAVQLAALKLAIRLAGRHDDPVIVQGLFDLFADTKDDSMSQALIDRADIKAPITDDGLGGDDADDDESEEEHDMVDPNAVSVKL